MAQHTQPEKNGNDEGSEQDSATARSFWDLAKRLVAVSPDEIREQDAKWQKTRSERQKPNG